MTDPAAISTVQAGSPATVLVEEVSATGVEDWYVTVKFTDILRGTDIGGNAVSYDSSNVTANINTLTESVVAPLTAIGSVVANDWTTDDSTGLAAGATPVENTLFYVSGQNSGNQYTATYSALVDFNLDLGNYTGTTATMSAPFVVTLYQ